MPRDGNDTEIKDLPALKININATSSALHKTKSRNAQPALTFHGGASTNNVWAKSCIKNYKSKTGGPNGFVNKQSFLLTQVNVYVYILHEQESNKVLVYKSILVLWFGLNSGLIFWFRALFDVKHWIYLTYSDWHLLFKQVWNKSSKTSKTIPKSRCGFVNKKWITFMPEVNIVLREQIKSLFTISQWPFDIVLLEINSMFTLVDLTKCFDLGLTWILTHYTC